MTDEELIQNELVRCNRCGYCLSTCPTYHVEHSEGQAARGRLALLRALSEGDATLTATAAGPDCPAKQALTEAVGGCLLCGACTEACFSAVRTDDLMVRARTALRGGRATAGWRAFTRNFLLHPERLTAVLRLAGVGRRSGMVRLLRRLSPALDLAEGLVEPAPREFLRDRLRELGFHPQVGGRWQSAADGLPPRSTPTGEGPGTWVLPRDPRALTVGPRVLYFIGCGTNFQLPEPGAAALRLLARAGCEVLVAPHVCCGLPPYSYGDLASARDLARRNVDLLGAARVDWIVTECGSCGRFLKRYPELLAEDPQARRGAEALGAKIRDFTELLATLPLPPPVAPFAGTLTYHDPCHLGRGQGLTAEPRRLLREAAGATLVELPEADWCCGGAGSYNLTHPERSQEILARKLGNLASTGAPVVATACPACILQLRSGLRESGSPMVVRHVAEIVAEAQGLTAINIEEGIARDSGKMV